MKLLTIFIAVTFLISGCLCDLPHYQWGNDICEEYTFQSSRSLINVDEINAGIIVSSTLPMEPSPWSYQPQFISSSEYMGVIGSVRTGEDSFNLLKRYTDSGSLPPEWLLLPHEMANSELSDLSNSNGGFDVDYMVHESPWSPSRRLVQIYIKSGSRDLRNLTYQLKVDSQIVKEYRILDHVHLPHSSSGIGSSPIVKNELKAGDVTTLIVEVSLRDGVVTEEVDELRYLNLSLEFYEGQSKYHKGVDLTDNLGGVRGLSYEVQLRAGMIWWALFNMDGFRNRGMFEMGVRGFLTSVIEERGDSDAGELLSLLEQYGLLLPDTNDGFCEVPLPVDACDVANRPY